MQAIRALLIKIVLVGFGILASLFLAELALRVIGYSAPIFRSSDPELGWRLRKNLAGYHRVEQPNYHEINAQGWNDDGYDPDKAPGTLRIAIVGDSFVHSAEVPRKQNFLSKLEQLLRVRLEQDVEVLNFGAVGYGTTQELLLLESDVLPLKPDIVVLVLFSGNDFQDNVKALQPTIAEERPYFELVHGRLKQVPGYPNLDQSAKQDFIASLINSSRLLQLVKEVRLRASARTDSQEAGNDAVQGNTVQDNAAQDDQKTAAPLYSLAEGVYKPAEGLWETSWLLTEELLKEFAIRVTKAQSKFLLVHIPEALQAHPDITAQKRLAQKLGVKNFDYPGSRLGNLAESQGMAYLDLAPLLRAKALEEQVYLYGFVGYNLGDGHLNEDGHEFVARRIDEAIAALPPSL